MNELKTSLHWAGRCPSCGCVESIDNMVGLITSMRRKVREKFSNLLCLTECGFYDRLEEGGLICPNMGTYSCPHEPATVIFSTSQLLEQNLKNYFIVLVLCQCCSRNDAVKLYGRFHPAPNLYEGDLLSGSWTLWVSRVEGVQGFLRGPWLQRYNESKVLTSFKGSRAQGFNLRGHGFKGLICQSSLKCFKGSRTSGAKGWRGSWVNCEVRGLEGHSK